MLLCAGHSGRGDLRNISPLEDLTPGELLEQGLNDLGYFLLHSNHYIKKQTTKKNQQQNKAKNCHFCILYV